MIMNLKPLRIVLPRMRAYVKCNDGKTKWKKFLIKDIVIIIAILKNNLIRNTSTINIF